MKLAFITDEVTQDFREIMIFAKRHVLRGVELRTVENMPIDMIPGQTLRQWRNILDAEGLTVCGLASSFYKCDPTSAAIEMELEKLRRLCEAASILGCENIRGFSFFAPESRLLSPIALAKYFNEPIRIIRDADKTLLLEADPSVNTPNHTILAALLKEINSNNVRAIFDPGNCLYDPLGEQPFPQGYEAICPYIAHVHIKDAIHTKPKSYCVKVGTGQVGYPALLSRLFQDGYDGWLSMETHYRLKSELTEEQLRLPGGTAFSAGGAAATAESIEALQAILANF